MEKYRLHEGLFLEDLNILIPWQAHFDELVALPITKVGGYRDNLSWGLRTALGGMSFRFSARFYNKDSKGDTNCDYLNHIFFNAPDWRADPLDTYSNLLPEFISRFGEPTTQYSDIQWPTAIWEFGIVEIIFHVYNQHSDFCGGYLKANLSSRKR